MPDTNAPQDPENNIDADIREVMQTLPAPIRHYLSSGEYSQAAQQLMAKYGLHIDQAGVLERELMLLLMGIESPQEFSEALTNEAGIPPTSVTALLQDVNRMVFIPLREKMQNGEAVSQVKQQDDRVSVPNYGNPASASHMGSAGQLKVSVPQSTIQTFSLPQAAPQPAPAYQAPAPLPPRQVMPGAPPNAVYAAPQPAQFEQVQPVQPRTAPVPGTAPAPMFREAPSILPQQMPQPAAQLETMPFPAPVPIEEGAYRQAEPPAPPPNLPGIYGQAPSFPRAQMAYGEPEPEVSVQAAAPYAPHQLASEPPVHAPPVPAEPPYFPRRVPAQPSAPASAAQRHVAGSFSSAPAQSPANTDPYLEPID